MAYHPFERLGLVNFSALSPLGKIDITVIEVPNSMMFGVLLRVAGSILFFRWLLML